MAAILSVYCVVNCSKIWHKINNWFQERTRYSWRQSTWANPDKARADIQMLMMIKRPQMAPHTPKEQS